jgi:cell division transport system ATP-binding protein
MIEFRGVSKEYRDGTAALSDIDLFIKPGEFVFLVGPSGAGKTTLIKLLIREERPTRGEIYFQEQEVTQLPSTLLPYLRREIGVVFQDYKLLPTRTVFENVALSLQVVGRGRQEIRDLVPTVLNLVDLRDKAGHFPDQLSGGEQQRVAIARALAHEPKVLIADEPTGDVDPTLTWSIARLLNRINEWGTTVIVATHDVDIVNTLNKRVIALERGRIVRDEAGGRYDL